MAERVRVKVMGITHNQIQQGAYALLLREVGGRHRIPVVVGVAEAQSIVAWLERVSLPRPLVHDLFKSATRAFGIQVKEVFVSKFEKGIFYSEITLDDGVRQVVVDSRTSDAIAIALRTNAPIYTTQQVIAEAGFLPEDDSLDADDDDSAADEEQEPRQVPLRRFAEAELRRMLADSISKEEYERAAEIKAAIEEKRHERQDK